MKVLTSKIVNGKKMFLIEDNNPQGKVFAQDGKPIKKENISNYNPYYVDVRGLNASESTKTNLTPTTKITPQEIKKIKESPTNVGNIKIKEAQEKAQRLKEAEEAYKKRKAGVSITPELLAQETQAIGDKISLQNIPGVGQYIPDILDVTGGIGSMASNLGALPLNLNRGNYGQALLSVATPLATGALAGVSSPTMGQFVNNLVNPLAGIGDLAKGVYNKGALSLENIGNKIDDKLTNLFYGKKGVSKSMNVIDRVEIKNIDKLKKRYKDEFENKYGKNYSDKDLELYVKLKKVEKGKLNDIDYNINEMEDFIDRNKISREYTSKDKLLTDIYTKGYYSFLNRRVTEGITYNKDLYEDVIPQFEDLILKNKLKKEEVLYRGNYDYLIKDVWRNGERLENVKFSDLQKGDEYKPNSFYSTSIDKNVATRFGNIASKIEAPKGQSVFVPNATKSGNFPNELEVVLPEKLRYRVDEIYEPKKLYNSIEDVADGQELGDYIKKGELLYYKYNDKYIPVPDNLIKVVLDRLNFDIAKNNKIKYKQSIVNPYILAPIVVGALGKESFQKQEKGGTVKVLKEKIVNGKKQFLIDIKD